jgi:hypothetical protein
MEWGILLGLALAVVATGLVNRARRRRRPPPGRDDKTIYPLW